MRQGTGLMWSWTVATHPGSLPSMASYARAIKEIQIQTSHTRSNGRTAWRSKDLGSLSESAEVCMNLLTKFDVEALRKVVAKVPKVLGSLNFIDVILVTRASWGVVEGVLARLFHAGALNDMESTYPSMV
eukprot:3269557-Amphidinium_carterae.3